MNIQDYWQAIITQNEEKLKTFFTEDAVIRWLCTNERFTASEYITANCKYPGNWIGEIERVEENGSKTVIAGAVQSTDGSIKCHVVSFIKLKDDKVCEMDEYWADDGKAPQWRKELGLGRPIKGENI